jgi:hypothetical protein
MISLTRTISQWRAVAVLAGLLTVTATNVASAHGGSRQAPYGVVVSRQCDVPSARTLAMREFRRGSIAGRSAGSSAGYDAGSCNGWYHPAPKIRLKRQSRSYRNGYATGYAQAYARSYRLAKRNQRHRAHVPRWW